MVYRKTGSEKSGRRNICLNLNLVTTFTVTRKYRTAVTEIPSITSTYLTIDSSFEVDFQK